MSTSASRLPTLVSIRMPRLGDDRLAALAAAGDERAFEALYDRHHRALLGFCRHMLGTLEEAEDALQQTFLRAHRALVERGAPAELRPWLYTIARNCCLTMLSARRPVADGEPELASTEGLSDQVQVRADLRAVVADVERLPDEQRAALVLAELADLSHDEIAVVIGVRSGKVKALIHQARTTLLAEREARETPCASIREQLSTARGGTLRRGHMRRHLRVCAGCRAYREAVGEQRSALALALPVTPSLGLKAGILGAASATGGAGAAAVGGASTAASLTGSLSAKLAAGALLVGGGATGGTAIVERADPAPRPAPVAVKAAAQSPVASPPTLRASLPAAAPPKRSAVSPRATRPRVRSPHAGRQASVAAPEPASRETPSEAAKPPKPAKRVKEPKPAKRVKAEKPAKPRRVKAPKAAKPVKTPKAAKPVKTPKPAKPVKVAKPAKPETVAKPAKPDKATKPTTR